MSEMIEIAQFKPKDIDDAIVGMDGLQQIIVPLLRQKNYEGMAEQDIQQFKRHITLAKHALVAMGGFLEGKMKKPDNPPQWISVKDRLPELKDLDSNGEVLSYDGKEAWITKPEYMQSEGITHWVPLPPKPEEGGRA